jgi:predicted RND superfamily exporter protein
VGTAMCVTTAALVAGFILLTFSGFKMNADMGLMTAITITLALALDFLFLPTLLMKVEVKTDETTDIEYDGMPVLAPVSSDGPGRDA